MLSQKSLVKNQMRNNQSYALFPISMITSTMRRRRDWDEDTVIIVYDCSKD